MTYAPLQRSKTPSLAGPKPTSHARRASGPPRNAEAFAEAERHLRGGFSAHPGSPTLRGFNPITGFTNGLPERVSRQSATARDLAPSASRSLVVQAKLEIGSVSDPLELEADRIADRVVNQAESPAVTTTASRARVQRMCNSCAEEDEVQMKPSSADGGQRVSSPMLTRGINDGRRHGGTPLLERTRDFMEPRFGRDFSNVRIHADLAAQRLAQSIRARAFTVGNDIFFGAGRYSPDSTPGRRLLAHELTHTLQQNRDTARIVVRRSASSSSSTKGSSKASSPWSELSETERVEWSASAKERMERIDSAASGELWRRARELVTNADPSLAPLLPAGLPRKRDAEVRVGTLNGKVVFVHVTLTYQMSRAGSRLRPRGNYDPKTQELRIERPGLEASILLQDRLAVNFEVDPEYGEIYDATGGDLRSVPEALIVSEVGKLADLVLHEFFHIQRRLRDAGVSPDPGVVFDSPRQLQMDRVHRSPDIAELVRNQDSKFVGRGAHLFEETFAILSAAQVLGQRPPSEQEFRAGYAARGDFGSTAGIANSGLGAIFRETQRYLDDEADLLQFQNDPMLLIWAIIRSAGRI